MIRNNDCPADATPILSAAAAGMIRMTRAELFSTPVGDGACQPLLLHGEAKSILKTLPDAVLDCCITSPPYWGQRQYGDHDNGEIGLEKDYRDYVTALCEIIAEVRRVLKATGSFWLNIGDSYRKKKLLGLPWRVALKLMDEQGWVLRNEVIWNKVKGGPDNSRDKLRCVHEHLFHFVLKERGYYYDVDAIRSPPSKAKIVNGVVVSATGVKGVRYRRQIELSTSLSEEQRAGAMSALDAMLQSVRDGELADFRMIIRGQQRTTHSDSQKVSGRARELAEKGYYFLRYHPDGAKPGDVWDIIPEDSHKRELHYAPFPQDLCRIPILATCPDEGWLLDPFCGTGTALVVATELGRRSVGIDTQRDYLEIAQRRCAEAT